MKQTFGLYVMSNEGWPLFLKESHVHNGRERWTQAYRLLPRFVPLRRTEAAAVRTLKEGPTLRQADEHNSRMRRAAATEPAKSEVCLLVSSKCFCCLSVI